MIPISPSEEEEPFIFTTSHNTLVIIENGSALFNASRGGGEITLSLGDIQEIFAKLQEAGIVRA